MFSTAHTASDADVAYTRCRQGTQQLLWPPLPALRVLCVGSSGAGHQARLHASQLHAFYNQVRSPVAAALHRCPFKEYDGSFRISAAPVPTQSACGSASTSYG